jgi:hypothetical protein
MHMIRKGQLRTTGKLHLPPRIRPREKFASEPYRVYPQTIPLA